MGKRELTNVIWAILVLGGAAGLVAADSTVADIVVKMPATDAAQGQPLIAQVIKLGPSAVMEVCRMIQAPGEGDDSKARFALHGMALHAKRPGAEAERKVVESALLEALSAASDAEVKAFLVEQLQWIGQEQAVAPLGKLLGDERLCEPAAQALQEIATPGAAEQLRGALPAAKGRNLTTIVRALGVFRDKASAKSILPHAAAEDKGLRHTAWYALANIGDASALDALRKAADSQGVHERGEGTRSLLLLARRLGESGDRDACVKVCRDLLKTRIDERSGNVRCACLQLLADVLAEGAMDDLAAAVEGKDRGVREAALEIVQRMSSQAVTGQWVAKAGNASGQVKAATIGMLGRRGDKSALPAITAALSDKDNSVRKAAMGAILQLAPKEAVAALMPMTKADDPNEIEALKGVLASATDGNPTKAAAEALPSASIPGRVALLELLAARGATDQASAVFNATADEDAQVRLAAVRALGSAAGPTDAPRVIELLGNAKTPAERNEAMAVVAGLCRRSPQGPQPVLDVLPKAEGEKRATLLQALARIGGPKAMEAVLADVQASDEAVQDAAVRALSDWQDAAAAPELLKLARDSKKDAHKVLSLRGYVRVVGLPSARTDAQTAAMYREALTVAQKPAEKKLVLAGLGNVRSADALKVAGDLLDDPDLTEEAAAAAIKIACPENEREKGLQGESVTEVLQKVIKVSKNAPVIAKAKKHLAAAQAANPPKPAAPAKGSSGPKGPIGASRPAGEAPAGSAPASKPSSRPRASAPATQPALPPLPAPDKDGFIALFNGKDLTGWVGAVGGYGVEDGVLYCDPKAGGNLFTAHQFSDFVIQFEFKLPPGGNNGLGIRAPLKGYTTTLGMEIQILDDTAPAHANLQPYQFHGSIYGVVPAKRGHLKPVGEWNSEEVRAMGPKITVILNGTTIVAADLDEVRKTADPNVLKAHPGLDRLKGHIGFLGHGTRVEFRSIRIKPIPPYTAGPQNAPPEGFVALFNGKDLTGWKGLAGNPKTRAAMTPQQLAAAQGKADESMRLHWKVEDGLIAFDGKGAALCTAKDYGDFEMYVDWKIEPRGDSGIYLRGSPQVQMWENRFGSGGLYNNKINPSNPLAVADNPPGEWNRFRIRMIGEKVWVWLNGELVVDGVIMENYWERDKPIYPTGQIELQNHSSPLWFRNVYIREIPRDGATTTPIRASQP